MSSDRDFDRNKIIRKKLKAFPSDSIKGLVFDIDAFNADYPEDMFINANELVLNFTMEGPEDTLWEGKKYKGSFNFPRGFPMAPPTVKFKENLYHPNVYARGEVCISILHAGHDSSNYESDNVRWSPIHTPSSIMASIMLIFDKPNINSPANVDASIMFQHNPTALRKLINGEMTRDEAMTETQKIRGKSDIYYSENEDEGEGGNENEDYDSDDN